MNPYLDDLDDDERLAIGLEADEADSHLEQQVNPYTGHDAMWDNETADD